MSRQDELGYWMVGGNKVRVCVTNIFGAPEVHEPINGAVLYGLLRRGDWCVYASVTEPVYLMLLEPGCVSFYKIPWAELDQFFDYYCGMNCPRELDWRKCGF